jgi:hypothetical protein
VKKTLKYAPVVEALRQAFTPCKVEQITLVIGLLGSTEESRWRQSLSAFGMTKSQQDKLIRKYMVATIEGSHLVLGGRRSIGIWPTTLLQASFFFWKQQ